MVEFEFPANIKQIGSIGDGVRIYLEDYACTYLQQYAETGGYEEQIALLIGRNMVIDGQKVLFISGVIKGMHCVKEKGILTFSDQSMTYAYEQMQQYFRGLEIVGWMQSQPGYGTMLNTNYANYHTQTFVKPDQVLFIVDPIEAVTQFYRFNQETEELEETSGYFIYYDKNKGMHEYMINNRLRPKSKLDLKSRKPETAKAVSTVSREEFNLDEMDDITEEELKKVDAIPVKMIAPRISRTTQNPEQKRVVNMLVSLSAVLVAVCFVMGAGLIQNEGRITNLEDQITTLSTSYRDALMQFNDGKTASVFAAQTESATSQQVLSEPSTTEIISDATKKISDNLMARVQVVKDITPTAMPVAEPTPTVVMTPEPTQVPQPVPQVTPEPKPTPIAENISDTKLYTVENGDSLIYISRKFYGTNSMIPTIMELNNISNADSLYAGQKIKLPVKK